MKLPRSSGLNSLGLKFVFLGLCFLGGVGQANDKIRDSAINMWVLLEGMTQAPLLYTKVRNANRIADHEEEKRLYELAATSTHVLDEAYYQVRNSWLSKHHLSSAPFELEQMPQSWKDSFKVFSQNQRRSREEVFPHTPGTYSQVSEFQDSMLEWTAKNYKIYCEHVLECSPLPHSKAAVMTLAKQLATYDEALRTQELLKDVLSGGESSGTSLTELQQLPDSPTMQFFLPQVRQELQQLTYAQQPVTTETTIALNQLLEKVVEENSPPLQIQTLSMEDFSHPVLKARWSVTTLANMSARELQELRRETGERRGRMTRQGYYPQLLHEKYGQMAIVQLAQLQRGFKVDSESHDEP